MGAKTKTPGRFTRSGRRARFKAKSLMASSAVMKLTKAADSLFLHTLSAKDLGVKPELSSAASLYYNPAVLVWRSAIGATFRGCCFYCLEVSKGQGDRKRGVVHCHAIAARNDGLGSKFAETAKLKPVYDLQGLLTYLSKPSEPYSFGASLDWQVSRLMSKGGQAPKTRGWLISKKRQAWNRQNPIDNYLDTLIENIEVLL